MREGKRSNDGCDDDDDENDDEEEGRTRRCQRCIKVALPGVPRSRFLLLRLSLARTLFTMRGAHTHHLCVCVC